MRTILRPIQGWGVSAGARPYFSLNACKNYLNWPKILGHAQQTPGVPLSSDLRSAVMIISRAFSADTRRLINVGLTFVRWTNVKPTFMQRLVSAG